MQRLKTTYLGMELSHPLVASAGPLTKSVDSICALADSGVSAIVMHSLFEEQITLEADYLDLYLSEGTDSYSEALSYFPSNRGYAVGPDAYLDLIAEAKRKTSIPIIGSLNGVSLGGWTEYARLIEEAGADALELNVYYIPTNARLDGAQVEEMYLALLREVKEQVSIPVAVKMSPFFSSIPSIAAKLDEAGANGLVLFNRFYQPNFDIENLEIIPDLKLSNPAELRLRLRWVAILYSLIKADMAVTGGVHNARGVFKAMMAGASVAMMTSALLKNGLPFVREVLDGINTWMDEHEYESIEQMRGSLCRKHCAEPAAFERANYLHVLSSYSTP